MRTIKFRNCCHKDKKCFHPWTPKEMFEASKDGSVWGDDNEQCQFTGLFDKDGVEIYEGDIVKSNNRYSFSSSQPDIYEIKWQEDVDNPNDYPNHISGYLIGGDAEVIGNIYENPELLNETHKDQK